MAVTLINKRRQLQVFNLAHAVYCEALGRCSCREQQVTTVEQHPQTGERSPRSRMRRLPASLTLLALERRESLPEAVLKVPEIRRAISTGGLRVVTQTSPSARKKKEQDKAETKS